MRAAVQVDLGTPQDMYGLHAASVRRYILRSFLAVFYGLQFALFLRRHQPHGSHLVHLVTVYTLSLSCLSLIYILSLSRAGIRITNGVRCTWSVQILPKMLRLSWQVCVRWVGS